MKELALDLHDEVLFESEFSPVSYCFLSKHMDAFARMWQEQGETFWLRYLISFRDYLYNRGFIAKIIHSPSNPVIMCPHRWMFTSDDIFITIHKELIKVSTPGRIKTFAQDLLCLGCNKEAVLAISGKSIVNNPFCHPESRDSFRRLLGLSLNLPSAFKGIFMLGIAIPTYMAFGGGLCTFLQRWLKTQNDCKLSSEINDLWVLPNDWSKSSYLPNRFEIYLANYYKERLADVLNIKGRKPMTNYDKLIKQIAANPKEMQFRVLDCNCESSEKPSYNSRHCNHDDFDKLLKGTSLMDQFELYLKETKMVEKLPGATEDQLKEEFRRKLLLDLAEDKFKKEFDCVEESKGPKSKKKKRKNRKKKRGPNSEFPPQAAAANALPKNTLTSSQSSTSKLEDSDSEVSDSDEDINICMAAFKSIEKSGGTARETITKKITITSSKDGELSQIHKNLDCIERCIHETGGLDIEHFSLLLKTGQLFKDSPKPNKTKAEAAQAIKSSSKPQPLPKAKKCAGCLKIEDQSFKMKKCARCKAENVMEPRYYCCRDCQLEDWKESHQLEHENGKLVKM